MVAAREPWCEQRDGDCPECPELRKLSPVAILKLSTAEPELVASAERADGVIRALSIMNGSDIVSFDEPRTGLHTSIF